MKSTDVTLIAAPFGFGPTGKSLAVSRELIRRGYSVKILGDENTIKLVNDAGILAYQYEYRTELNLADLRSKVVVSYLDISTKIINESNIPLVFADSLFLSRGRLENPQAQERFPLGKDGAKEIVDHLENYLNKEKIPNAYYRVSVKARIRQNDKIILVKEDGKKWDLPGGGVEHNESMMDALHRELKEEIGLKDFYVQKSPTLFKMIDKSANRPLLFVVYDIDIKPNTKLNAAKNVTIGVFDDSDMPDTVAYSKDYAEYIRNSSWKK